MSDELWKLKTHFRCFQVMESELWWHFCNYTHIWGTHSQAMVMSRCYFWQTPTAPSANTQPDQFHTTTPKLKTSSNLIPPHAHNLINFFFFFLFCFVLFCFFVFLFFFCVFLLWNVFFYHGSWVEHIKSDPFQFNQHELEI